MTVLLSHIFIGLSLLMRNVLKQIPLPVLDGLFLYLALTSLDGNQFFERVTLFFTEQVRVTRRTVFEDANVVSRLPTRRITTFVKCRSVKYISSPSFN